MGGGKADAHHAAVFKQTLGEELTVKHVADLTDNCDYHRSAAIYGMCDMYVGNDTGNMLIAAAVKIPVLMPHYFAADLPAADYTTPRGDYPYRVPSVIVMPTHALDDCKNSTTHYGCKVADRPHCITQVKVPTMFAAYQLLKERITEKNIEPLFVT